MENVLGRRLFLDPRSAGFALIDLPVLGWAKDKPRAANVELVVTAEHTGSFDRFSVEQRAVGAAHIIKVVKAIDEIDLCVLARNGWVVVDNDIVCVSATNGKRVAEQLVAGSRVNID